MGFFTSRTFAAAAVVGASLVLLLPAQAQFWDWGRPRYREPFRDWFSPFPRYEPRSQPRERYDRDGGSEREFPGDFSRAPPPAQKKPEATTSVLVLGDSNADWLGYGLEDAYSEKPELGVIRKPRTDSGLIRYDPRRETEWAQVAREIITAEKPKFIVMMIGSNDRQAIREKAPPVVRPANPKASPQGGQPPQASPPAGTTAPQAPDPEQHAAETPQPEQPPTNVPPAEARQASYGPWEFHSEKWEAAYIRRVDVTIAALKSAGVPVIWVGLPAQRNPKASTDSSYLNEIFRSRAEKAGVIYVDIWDGFVDESGRFSPQGPDYEGQIRRLRTSDGVYFTKFGARKLAHYVDREIQRHLTNRAVPVALPTPSDATPQAPGKPAAQPGTPTHRPAAGPVVPLTATNAAPGDELMGGGRSSRAPAADPTVTRVLTKGEPVSPPSGRADDFSWPRNTIVSDPSLLEITPVPANVPGAAANSQAQGKKTTTAATPTETKPPPPQRPAYNAPQLNLPRMLQNLFRF
jgi:uncharacterized protein